MTPLSRLLRKYVVIVASLLALPSQATPESLCHSQEAVQFNCLIGKKKTVSLCAALDSGGTPRALTYRYGTANRVENEFTATAENGRVFQGTVMPADPGASVSQVWFDRGPVRYLMTECVGGACPFSAGLAVLKDDQILMNARCINPPGTRSPAFSRELVQFGSRIEESRSFTPLLRLEEADNGITDIYRTNRPPR